MDTVTHQGASLGSFTAGAASGTAAAFEGGDTLVADGLGCPRETSGNRPHSHAAPEQSGCGRPGPELQRVLAQVAQRIVEDGTHSSAGVLEAMSAVVRPVSLGVAAALVDRELSEVARQRAFGMAHSLVVEVVDESVQRLLLELIEVAQHGSPDRATSDTTSDRSDVLAVSP